jgi:hypothetical protein
MPEIMTETEMQEDVSEEIAFEDEDMTQAWSWKRSPRRMLIVADKNIYTDCGTKEEESLENGIKEKERYDTIKGLMRPVSLWDGDGDLVS